ncbi:POLR3F [Bugula neritina]|uniref:POLR3F n=1 Tax=Bugula neritina TaxID=10212 RepID=A0A7J7JMH3_BUGNE|nr:POLR3F [Bugula neritina]
MSNENMQNAKKKVYMLYDLQPDKSVTGGPWYSDQGFESEYVDVLTNQCHRFLQNKYEDACGKHTDPITIKNSSYASVEEICEYISALGISKVKLSADDMGMVMDALMYDNKVERSFDPSNQEALYKVVNSPLNSTPMVKVPCGVCPVAAQCEIGGIVSPSNCIYLDDWLTF